MSSMIIQTATQLYGGNGGFYIYILTIKLNIWLRFWLALFPSIWRLFKTTLLLLFQELLVNLNYSDPQDAESDLWPIHGVSGNINQAYEAEDILTSEAAHHHHHRPHPRVEKPVRQQTQLDANNSYKVKFGHEIYYCKPYQPFHTQLRYNFSGNEIFDWLLNNR